MYGGGDDGGERRRMAKGGREGLGRLGVAYPAGSIVKFREKALSDHS